MRATSFHVSCIIDNRPETLPAFGDRVLRTLDAVSRICPFCEKWKVADFSAGRMVALARYRTRMDELARRGVSRDDDGEPDPEYGYKIAASNDPRGSGRSVSMSFSSAGNSPAQPKGHAQWETDYLEPADPALVTYPVIRAVLQTMIEVCRPDYASAFTNDLAEYRLRPGRPFDMEWLRYLSAPYAARILPPPPTLLTERDSEGGLLLIAAEETFDVDNVAHMAGALAIREVTAPLNPPLPPPWRPGL